MKFGSLILIASTLLITQTSSAAYLAKIACTKKNEGSFKGSILVGSNPGSQTSKVSGKLEIQFLDMNGKKVGGDVELQGTLQKDRHGTMLSFGYQQVQIDGITYTVGAAITDGKLGTISMFKGTFADQSPEDYTAIEDMTCTAK